MSAREIVLSLGDQDPAAEDQKLPQFVVSHHEYPQIGKAVPIHAAGPAC